MIKLKDFNPSRLKNARMYRAKTLDILANESKVNKKDILAFEEGKYLPTLENSLKLSKTLDFPQEYFYKKDNTKVILENTHIAVPGRVPRVEEVACREKLLMTHKIIYVLEEFMDIPKVTLPSGMEKNLNEEQLAQKIREYFKLSNSSILNVSKVMENNGIIISDINVNKKGSVALTQKQKINNDVRYIVCLGDDDNSLAKRNYEMAYELAYIISNNLNIPTKRFSKDDFASAFLLPENEFKKDLKNPENLNEYVELKEKWNVPIVIMLYRAHNIGVLNYKKYNYLMQEMNKKGWLSKEPLDDKIKVSEQTMLNNVYRNNNIDNLVSILSENGIDIYSQDINALLGRK